MMGCLVLWKCLVACLCGESSQQPTWPQVRQRRRCTHFEPIFKHSSQPSALGVTVRMVSRWLQVSVTDRTSCRVDDLFRDSVCSEIGVDGSDDLRALANRCRHALHRTGTHIADGENAR